MPDGSTELPDGSTGVHDKPTNRTVFITRQKYKGILDILHQCVKDETVVREFDQKLQVFLNYNPANPCYNKAEGNRLYELRKQKAKDQGKTFYELYTKPYRKKKTHDDRVNSVSAPSV